MADQGNPAWPTADDDRSSTGFPQVDPDKTKPSPESEEPRAVPMRIEPGKPPKPAQLRSDPPAGATTWFESPGEPPRAMPMRIEPTGKPTKPDDAPKPVTAMAKEEEKEQKGPKEETSVGRPVGKPVEESVEESAGASSPGSAPGSDESSASDSRESAPGSDESAPVSSDSDPGPGDQQDAESVEVQETGVEDESEPLAAEDDGDAPVPGSDEPESPVTEPAEDGPADSETVEVAKAGDEEPEEPAAESGPAETSSDPETPASESPERPDDSKTVQVEQVAKTSDAEPDSQDEPPVTEQPAGPPVAEQPAGPPVTGHPAGPAESETVQVEQVAKATDAEPDSQIEPPVSEHSVGPVEQVAKASEGESEVLAEPAAPTAPAEVEQAADAESVDEDEPDTAASQDTEEPAESETAQVAKAEDAASQTEPPVTEISAGPADSETLQVLYVAKTADVEQVADSEAAQQAEDAWPDREDQPPVADRAAEPAETETDAAEPVTRGAPSLFERPEGLTEQREPSLFERPTGEVAEPVSQSEPSLFERAVPADSATVQVPQVAKAADAEVTEDEPEEPPAPAEAEPDASSEAEPRPDDEPVGEKTVQVLPVPKPDKVGETQPVQRPAPTGFGGLRRTDVAETQPAARKDPDGFGGLRRDAGTTQPVSQRDVVGPPKPERRTKSEPVGEQTVQVRPVQKPDAPKPPVEEKKGPDTWFSVPTRSQPTPPPTRPALPQRPPVGDKTTQLPARPPQRPKAPEAFTPFSAPTRSQPMPPPARPKLPDTTRSLHVPPPVRPKPPETPGRTPTRPKSPEQTRPKAFESSPPPTRPKLPEPHGPKAPMGLETSGQAPKRTEEPPPSNEDTQRSLPPLASKTSKKPPKRLLVLVAIVAVIALGAGVVFFVPGVKEGLGFGGSEAEAAVAPPPAPVAFTPNLKAPSAQAPRPTPQGVQSTLAGPAGNPALGTLTGSVIDAVTGNVLWEKSPSTPLTPASTTKVLTAAAALLKLPHSQQFSTKVVAGPQPGSVIIVGGGDATLNSLPAGKNSVFPGSARLDDLVAQVKAKGPVTQVFLDRTRYTGEDLAPGVLPGDVGEGYISPITPLMMDAARADPTKDRSPRSSNPPRAVANEFAKRIGATMAAKPEVTAPADAQILGEVKSAPLTELVDQFLQASDNVLADVIAREVTKAAGAEPSFAGLHTAVLQVLSENGFDVTGAELSDGSGMSTNNKSPARLLAQILAVAAGDGKDPRTTKLRPLLGGLPVAGGSGTLAGRFGDGQAANGKGWVRAKTGTLPAAQINSLAGVVLDADGRILVFALMTSQSDTLAARPALDAVAAALRSCGCK